MVVGSKSMRQPVDIVEVAEVVAAAENRSATEQVTYWTRIGMNVDRASTVDARRVKAVATGQEQFSVLSGGERVAAHALVDGRISELAAAQSFGRGTRAQGHTTVSLDDDGNLVEVAADGTSRPL